MSNRVKDMKAEQELGIFLDKYLYAGMMRANSVQNIHRNSDLTKQIDGIDVQVVLKNEKVINIDEKAQLYYMNRNLNTYAFELSFINRANNLSQGWLFDESKKTDMYVLIYPNSTKEEVGEVESEDFTDVTCLFIDRSKLLEFLSPYKQYIKDMDTYIRHNNLFGKIPMDNISDMYFFATDPKKLKEYPINLVIKRNILDNLAKYIFTISDKKLRKVK